MEWPCRRISSKRVDRLSTLLICKHASKSARPCLYTIRVRQGKRAYLTGLVKESSLPTQLAEESKSRKRRQPNPPRRASDLLESRRMQRQPRNWKRPRRLADLEESRLMPHRPRNQSRSQQTPSRPVNRKESQRTPVKRPAEESKLTLRRVPNPPRYSNSQFSIWP